MTTPSLVPIRKQEGAVAQVTADVVPTFTLNVGGNTTVVWMLHEILPILLEKASDFAAHLDSLTDDDMTIRGYTVEEAASLRTAYSSLAELHQVATGKASRPTPVDMLEPARQLPIAGPR